jgi:large subunit ribosomal protein L6
VSATITDDTVIVKGPKGQLSQSIMGLVSVELDGDTIHVKRDNESKPSRSRHGLMRSLVYNMVQGVHAGFVKELEVKGVGWKAEAKGNVLEMHLGFSHPIAYPIPAGIEVVTDKASKIKVSGIDKQQVGQVAAEIRSFRPPDHYKGKGVRYVGEMVRIKAGKTA